MHGRGRGDRLGEREVTRSGQARLPISDEQREALRARGRAAAQARWGNQLNRDRWAKASRAAPSSPSSVEENDESEGEQDASSSAEAEDPDGGWGTAPSVPLAAPRVASPVVQPTCEQLSLPRPSTLASSQNEPRKTSSGRQETSATDALKSACFVCSLCAAEPDNDLGLCDRCDRGYHQKCHVPEIPNFGNPADQWFCGECTEELAQSHHLGFRAGDFGWTAWDSTVLAAGAADEPLWPVRVRRIDFSSETDIKPYEAFFFGRPSKASVAWCSDEKLRPWHEGPTRELLFRDPRRLRALRLAEEGGAERLSLYAFRLADVPHVVKLEPIVVKLEPVTKRQRGEGLDDDLSF